MAKNKKTKEKVAIAEELLLKISRTLKPLLHRVDNNMIITLDYSPKNLLRARCSFDNNTIKEIERIIDNSNSYLKEYDIVSNNKREKKKNTGLRVIRKDGSILKEKTASMTFVNAIREAGLECVANLNISYCRINIVSSYKDQKYGKAQHEVNPGVFIFTHCSTEVKKKILDKINIALDMGWLVEVVK